MVTVNLVPFGPDAGDQKVHPGMLTSGQTINLHMFFPFYGGYYNYSVVSKFYRNKNINKIFICRKWTKLKRIQ